MKLFHLFLLLLLGTEALSAQDALQPTDYDVPVSPAFMLLDVSPTMVDRPVSAKAFTTSVLNSVADGVGFPDDYSLELTPMLLLPSRNADHNRYYGIVKSESGVRQNPLAQLKYFSFSAASINETLDSAAAFRANNLSLGLRFRLVQLQKKRAVQAYTDATTAYLRRLAEIRDNIMLTPDQVLEQLKNDKKLQQLETPILEALAYKPVFTVDLAGAVAFRAVDANFSSLGTARYAAWLTACYANSLNGKDAEDRDDFINLYAFGRILSDDGFFAEVPTFTRQEWLDFGFKVELEMKRFSFSYELLQRQFLDGGVGNTLRSSGLLGYALTDKVSAYMVFGKNFGDRENLIAQISLNYGVYGRSIDVQR